MHWHLSNLLISLFIVLVLEIVKKNTFTIELEWLFSLQGLNACYLKFLAYVLQQV